MQFVECLSCSLTTYWNEPGCVIRFGTGKEFPFTEVKVDVQVSVHPVSLHAVPASPSPWKQHFSTLSLFVSVTDHLWSSDLCSTKAYSSPLMNHIYNYLINYLISCLSPPQDCSFPEAQDHGCLAQHCILDIKHTTQHTQEVFSCGTRRPSNHFTRAPCFFNLHLFIWETKTASKRERQTDPIY